MKLTGGLFLHSSGSAFRGDSPLGPFVRCALLNKADLPQLRILFKILQVLGMVILMSATAEAQIVAAVLPSSHSVAVGGTATAFATILNAGSTAATNCSISPSTSVPATLVYQTTNPTTNAVTGQPNTPVNIAAGGSQTFVIAFTPTATFGATDVALNFACANTDPAPSLSGLNTLLLSASSGAPDIVTLAGTVSNDGILHLPSSLGSAAFVVATVNLGASDQITASADTGGATLPVTLTICQTNPATSVCLGTPAASAIATIATNATPTFAIFATATNNVAPLYAPNRIYVRFTDTTGTVHGSTSVGVATRGYNPRLPPALNFTPTSPPAGVVGQAYAFSFCNPQPMPIPTGLCGFSTQSNPIGGNPPYHFQLDSRSGFPLIGISLGKDGWLTGTPAAAGTSPFGVCAIDLNGAQVCVDTSVTVTGPSGSEPTNLEPPVVSGTAQVGQVLASMTGTWTGATSYAYQWAGNGAPIAAATAATYTPVSSDVGHTLTSTVTATGSSGAAASATSAPTVPIVAATVNGACGPANGVPVLTAPTTNLCLAGTASAVTGSGPWAWSCAGSISGTTATCSAPLAQNPPPPSGLLPPDRNASANWQMAGLQSIGGIPNRTAQCGATINPLGNGQDDTANIQNAIGNCPSGQVVQLASGMFTIAEGNYVLVNNAITLRGAGPGTTILQRGTTGANLQPGAAIGSNPSPLIIVGPAQFGIEFGTSPDVSTDSINLTADGASGSTTITLNCGGNCGSYFSVGQIVLLDETSNAGWQPDVTGTATQVWAAPDYRVTWRKHNRRNNTLMTSTRPSIHISLKPMATNIAGWIA